MAQVEAGPTGDNGGDRGVTYAINDDHALLWSMVTVTAAPKNALLLPGKKMSIPSSTLMNMVGTAGWAIEQFEVSEVLAPNWKGIDAARVREQNFG